MGLCEFQPASFRKIKDGLIILFRRTKMRVEFFGVKEVVIIRTGRIVYLLNSDVSAA